MIGVDINIDYKTFTKLKDFPNKLIYRVARQTLDLSYIHIPLSKNVNNGRLRSSSMAYGIKQNGHLHYSIGSQISYAKYVWVMDNATTNWSTAGTGSEWYYNQFKKKGMSIVQNAIRTSL
jgi:hypothetical protein